MRWSATHIDRLQARRRTGKALSLKLILMGLAVALPGAASAHFSAGDGGWSKQRSGSVRSLRAVAFSDASRGWAAGEYGTILATVNGDATWSAKASGSDAELYGIAFSDASHGWTVGDGGAILATANDGDTWSTQASGTYWELYGIAFSDGLNG